MTVEVNLESGEKIQVSGVATEETLRRVADAVEKVSPGGSLGKAFTEASTGAKKVAKENAKYSVQLKGLTKSADDLANELDDAADSAGGFGNKLMGMASKVADAATDVLKFAGNTAGAGLNMKQVGGFAEDIAGKLPIFGGALGAGAGVIIGHTANLADSFDQLTRTGAAFSGNLFDIERAAANSYLTLEQFGGIIRENSASFSVFGGTAKLGAQRFVALNQELQKTSRERLRYLGISAEESAEMLGEFMTMNSRNTAFQSMSVRQQTQAAANFSEEITKLATLTGQDRKALAEKMAREKQDSQTEIMINKMGVEQAGDTRNTLALLEEKFGKTSPVLDIVRAQISGLGVATTKEGKLLSQTSLGRTATEIGQMLANGGGGMEEAIAKFQGTLKASDAELGGFVKQAAYSDTAQVFTDSYYALQGFNNSVKAVTDKNGKVTIPTVDMSNVTKSVKDTQMLVEDAGKTVRLGINTFSESVVKPMGEALSGLKTKLENFDISDPATATAMADFKTNTVAASGASSGFAKAASEAAKKLATIGLSTADDAAKVAGTVGSTASAGAKVASGATGILSKFLGKLPVIGALVTGGITAAETGSVVEGAATGGGSFLGGAGGTAAGAAIGTMVFPGVGTAIGAVLGGLLGSFAGEAAGQGVASGGERFGTIGKLFGFEEGGVIRQPTLGMIGEGTSDEAVVPLPNNRNIPVDMDMSAITNLAKSVEKLIEQGNLQRDNTEVVKELQKLNKQTGKVVTLQS